MKFKLPKNNTKTHFANTSAFLLTDLHISSTKITDFDDNSIISNDFFLQKKNNSPLHLLSSLFFNFTIGI